MAVVGRQHNPRAQGASRQPPSDAFVPCTVSAQPPQSSITPELNASSLVREAWINNEEVISQGKCPQECIHHCLVQK